MPRLPRRLARDARDRLVAPLTDRVDSLQASVEQIRRDVDRIGEDVGRITEMLRFVTCEGAANRRRLRSVGYQGRPRRCDRDRRPGPPQVISGPGRRAAGAAAADAAPT